MKPYDFGTCSTPLTTKKKKDWNLQSIFDECFLIYSYIGFCIFGYLKRMMQITVYLSRSHPPFLCVLDKRSEVCLHHLLRPFPSSHPCARGTPSRHLRIRYLGWWHGRLLFCPVRLLARGSCRIGRTCPAHRRRMSYQNQRWIGCLLFCYLLCWCSTGWDHCHRHLPASTPSEVRTFCSSWSSWPSCEMQRPLRVSVRDEVRTCGLLERARPPRTDNQQHRLQ